MKRFLIALVGLAIITLIGYGLFIWANFEPLLARVIRIELVAFGGIVAAMILITILAVVYSALQVCLGLITGSAFKSKKKVSEEDADS